MEVQKLRPGDKLVFKYLLNGYEHEQAMIERYANVGDIFTIKNVRVDMWRTDIQFEEIEHEWNSVFFEKAE